MSNLLNISSSPHVRDKSSTRSIMWDVIFALIPTSIFGIYNFGIRAAVLIAVCIATCLLSEYIWQKCMKLPLTVNDGSAVLTGLLLALNLTPTFPIWMAILGSIFAIIIVKQLFGGLGQNFMNPALGARCFLMVSFAGQMTSFAHDGITGATPLALLKAGESVNVLDMVIGRIPGTIGETSAIAILIGAVILLAFKVIDLKIPLTYIGSFAVFVILYMLGTGKGFDVNYLFSHLFGGGLMLGAWFMATDYVTTPITPKGQLLYGCCLGVVTAIFRLFGGSAEGVSYAIIFCNLLVPLIEKVTKPVAFGKGGAKK